VPVEVPDDIVARVRALCLALPEVTVRVDESLTAERSTAWSFDIRRRSFCLLVVRADPAGQPVPLLVPRARPDEREALLSTGHPFFPSRAGRHCSTTNSDPRTRAPSPPKDAIEWTLCHSKVPLRGIGGVLPGDPRR
jgi:hypothetical protein